MGRTSSSKLTRSLPPPPPCPAPPPLAPPRPAVSPAAPPSGSSLGSEESSPHASNVSEQTNDAYALNLAPECCVDRMRTAYHGSTQREKMCTTPSRPSVCNKRSSRYLN